MSISENIDIPFYYGNEEIVHVRAIIQLYSQFLQLSFPPISNIRNIRENWKNLPCQSQQPQKFVGRIIRSLVKDPYGGSDDIIDDECFLNSSLNDDDDSSDNDMESEVNRKTFWTLDEISIFNLYSLTAYDNFSIADRIYNLTEWDAEEGLPLDFIKLSYEDYLVQYHDNDHNISVLYCRPTVGRNLDEFSTDEHFVYSSEPYIQGVGYHENSVSSTDSCCWKSTLIHSCECSKKNQNKNSVNLDILDAICCDQDVTQSQEKELLNLIESLGLCGGHNNNDQTFGNI